MDVLTPRVFQPLLAPAELKGGKGGRGSGKSHFFAELLVEEHVRWPDHQSVCIREIQKSLKFSAKKLIETKIRKFNVQHLFEITNTEIRRIGHEGLIIFQGMQDHTADSIKSLEGFNRAWVEEAQSLSARSVRLLLPTIRNDDSEIWFSWNPEKPEDPVEKLLPEMLVVHANFTDNPFCPQKLKNEAERHLRIDPDTYDHVWLGGYNILSDAQIFKGKFTFEEFEVGETWQPYYGLDWGFSQDPTACVEVYIQHGILFVRRATGKVGLELDHTADFIKKTMSGIEKRTIRADSARPESISYCRRNGLPLVKGVKKWKGSVEDGIEFMKSFEKIVIHPECRAVHDEFRLYSYHVDPKTEDITHKIVDKNNHYIDAIRYALEPFITQSKAPSVRSL